MRVFTIVYFDLKQRIPFKETLAYVQERMQSVPFPYGGISIDFRDFSIEKNRGEALLKRFPQMERYLAGCDFIANAVASEDEEIIRDIVTMVPRPFFFEMMKIALENVNWFVGAPHPPIQLFPQCDVSDQAFASVSPLSNRVIISKEYGFGTKYNPVKVEIEITKSMQESMDVAPVLQKLTEWFGKPRNNHMLVEFSMEEQQMLLERKKDIIPRLEILAAKTKKELAQVLLPLPSFSVFDHQEGLRPLAGLEVKPPLRALSKAHGYRYMGYSSYRFVCRKVNECNHCFEIVAYVEKTKHLGLQLEIRGFNFEFRLPLGAVLSTSQVDMEGGLSHCFEKGVELVQNIAPMLVKSFGPSPDWMTY
ncbi:MAG: hypothetical protein FWD25_01445 [Clostridia bacterium]|nr:hypothetical protein [Clostridia bacterium]